MIEEIKSRRKEGSMTTVSFTDRRDDLKGSALPQYLLPSPLMGRGSG